jgi:hypothetical protein
MTSSSWIRPYGPSRRVGAAAGHLFAERTGMRYAGAHAAGVPSSRATTAGYMTRTGIVAPGGYRSLGRLQPR